MLFWLSKGHHFFLSHIFPLLTALSTRLNYSGREIRGIFNWGDYEKAETVFGEQNLQI